MADRNPHDQGKFRFNIPATPVAQDYYAVLSRVIGEASRDPAQLRKLVYALAWNYLKPDARPTLTPPDPKEQAKAMLEVEIARRQLERAISHIETDSVRNAHETAAAAAQQAELQSSSELHPFAGGWQGSDQHPRDLDESPKAVPEPEPAPEQHSTPSDNAVIILPERAPSWLVQRPRDELFPEHLPQYWDHRYHGAPGPAYHAPPHPVRSGIFSFLQLVAAAVIGVVLYVGVAGWVQIGQQRPAPPPPMVASPQPPPRPIETTARAPDVIPEPKAAAAESKSSLPFPVPRSYGVYAGNGGQLAELAPLPIKVPDPRVLVSAEITRPSRTVLPAGELSFIVFRRDLVSSAPQVVSVRVVARISRVMKFVDGRPNVSPIEGTWRIRSKSYELKVTPLEDRPEMILLQPEPGFVFPPGRYALVLNGYGFDFAVAGTVTSTEQCLEQAELANGTILNECPNA